MVKNLTTPEKIETLRRKLYAKAKAEPDFRFYQLYDKIFEATSSPTRTSWREPMPARLAWMA